MGAIKPFHFNYFTLLLPEHLDFIFSYFFDMIAKLQKATMSTITSVCPHGTTWLPLDEFS
jgi:hypothetical protein